MQWKRGSSRVETGTSRFLSYSDFDLGVSAELEQENQACLVLKHRTPLVSLVVHGISGHLLSGIWHLWLFPEDATWVSVLPCV